MPEGKAILAVGCNPRNLELLAEFLGREGYRVLPGDSVEACDQAVANAAVSLIVLDLCNCDSHVGERCERMRQLRLPFLALSRRADVRAREACLAHGARAVLCKPLAVRELVDVIRYSLGP